MSTRIHIYYVYSHGYLYHMKAFYVGTVEEYTLQPKHFNACLNIYCNKANFLFSASEELYTISKAKFVAFVCRLVRPIGCCKMSASIIFFNPGQTICMPAILGRRRIQQKPFQLNRTCQLQEAAPAQFRPLSAPALSRWKQRIQKKVGHNGSAMF